MFEIDGWGVGISLPTIDDSVRNEWAGAVHAALRAAIPTGSVQGDVQDPGPGWNYYSIAVRLHGDEPERLLLNAAAKLVAYATEAKPSALGIFQFHDVPSSYVFLAAGFRVASVSDLTTQLGPHHVAALGPIEQADIALHRPQTLGDVLFNWFD